MAFLKQNGVVVANVPLERLDHFFEENKLNRADYTIEPSSDEVKEGIRQTIDETVEPLTREGVISDVAAVLVVGLASVVKAISAGKDLAEVKGAVAGLQPFADAVLGSLVTPADMKDPAAAIAAGKVIMPYMVKGDASMVVKDMGELANGVSLALIARRKAV